MALSQTTSETLSAGGLERSYLRHVPPAYTGDGPIPLVVALHGRGGSGAQMAALTDFDRLADAEGFIVLYPDGIDNEWNYVMDIPGYAVVQDDVAFLTDLVAATETGYEVDPARVYVAGFSNGGFMTARLACDAADTFAAFASVGAAGFGGMPNVCDRPHPVSMLLIHGTADAVVPYTGMSQRNSAGQDVLILASVAQTMVFWAVFGGCGSRADVRRLPQGGLSPGTSVKVFTLEACPAGSDIVLYAVTGGGHNWPGAQDKLPAQIAGAVNLDFSASKVIWEFFKAHPRTP